MLAAALLALACGRTGAPVAERIRLADILTAPPAAGYARALGPRSFHFPSDHGPHPDFGTEWWYFTGHLAAGDGRRLGFQLTFFRHAVAPTMPPRGSAWATRQVWMAHFAISDLEAGRFHAFERLARGALGLAGAAPGDAASPYRLWVGPWRATGTEPGRFLPVRLRAAAGEESLDLTLGAGGPPVLQGEGGLSRKGPAPGEASYYVSLPRMPVVGEVRVDGRRRAVSGLAWMDREWSTDALPAGIVGWDWFALQLDDGRSLMLYRLRRGDGSAGRFSSGSLVAADGAVRPLAADAFSIVDLDHWQSPGSGVVYPSRWRLAVPGAGLDLTVVPQLADQELDLSVRYWEGAVAVSGSAAGRVVSGQGYAELTGYGDAAPPGPGRGRS